jgi:hypothetical protein
MGYLDYAGLQYLWGKLKEKFAPKSHTHDDRYYTEAEMDGKLNSKVNNTRDGANSLINALDSGTAAPTDPDYIITQWVGGGTSNTTWVRRPASSFWAYIKGKADGVYQPKGSYAASNHSHTKDQVGLGNVDNTADANKSVKYATNAGSANSLSGLSSRSSQSWGVQTGTFIHGEGDTTGGDFAFRRDCPNAGQISMVLDGRFYQNEGQYRVLDTSDEANLNVRSANFAKETYINRYKTVNLTDLDQNTWYPVTGTYIPYRGLRRFKCSVQLDSGSKPSWSAHSAGFTAVVDILEEPFGWGTTSMQGMVLVNDQRFIADESKPPVGYGQLGNSSIPVWWLRGGGTYFLAADYDCTWTIRKSKFEKNGQSVEPRTTYPGVNVNRSTITANLNGNATTADVANAVDWSKVQNKPSSYPPASHSHAYLPTGGGTMSGALNFANNTWNPVGDDVQIGDHNTSGSFYVQGLNGATNIKLKKKGDTSEGAGDSATITYDGGNLIIDKTIQANLSGTADSATTSNGVKDYNDANKTIKIGFAGAGLTTENLGYVAGYADNGTKIKDVSKDVLKSWIGLGNYLPLIGGTMSGQITKSTGGSWIGDRDRAAIKSSYAGDSSYGAVAGMATKNGYWTMGNLGGNESLIFNYSTDANYNAGNNSTAQVYLPAQAGTIITSATIGSQSVNYANSAGSATSAGSVAWGNVSGKPSTFTPASHTHDDRYYTESEVNTKLANYQPKGNYAAASHTHNYAGSGTAGGSANSAVKLDSSAGSATQPVYFKDGKPVATTYTLNKTVPADAKFTDTDTWRGIQNNLTSDSTDQSLSAAQGKALKTLVDGKAPISHTHKKSQITDFPSSMPASDVYAWAKAATKPSYTKAEVGLGNVDNTADKDKNVNYATTAGSADNGVAASSVGSSGYPGYIRFNNGIQICWGVGSSGSANGSFFFPQNFLKAPCITISGTGAYRYAFYVTNNTTRYFSYFRDGSGETAKPQYVAIGLWEQS